jgi:hypothetical protein
VRPHVRAAGIPNFFSHLKVLQVSLPLLFEFLYPHRKKNLKKKKTNLKKKKKTSFKIVVSEEETSSDCGKAAS